MAVGQPLAFSDEHLLRVHRGPEVDGEREDVKGEDDGDDPLDDGGGVVLLGAGADTKGNTEGHLEYDEEQL